MAAIWRVNNTPSHSPSPAQPPSTPPPKRSSSSSAAAHDLLPQDITSNLTPLVPSTPPQSLVLLHSPNSSRRPQRASPLHLFTTPDNREGKDEGTPGSHTSTSYATLSLLSAVGSGSGRGKLKDFPGLIPLSRYFIPPAEGADTPTTPTTPTKSSNNNPVIKEEGVVVVALEGEEKKSHKSSKSIGSGFTTPEGSPTNTLRRKKKRSTGSAEDDEMDQNNAVAIVGDPEPLMTQDLLNFYKNRLHELETSTQAQLLERLSVLRGFLLEHHDATNRLERQLHELQAENKSLSKDMQDSIRHRMEMIALAKENEVLKERLDQLSKANENYYPPAPIPSPEPSVTSSMKEDHDPEYERITSHYEDLISQLLQQYADQCASRDSERSLANQNIDQLNDRCMRLETAVSDSLKDTILERGKRVAFEEKLKETEEELNVSVWEMQSQIEIFERHINESRMTPEGLGTVREERGYGGDGVDSDGDVGDVIPEDMFDTIPDTTAVTLGHARSRSASSRASRRSNPRSPTKSVSRESSDSGVKESSCQTDDPEGVTTLREELQGMIEERKVEEDGLRQKKQEFEKAYEKFAGLIENAKSREQEYNLLKAECEGLRKEVENLVGLHERDQHELQEREKDLDLLYKDLENAVEQGKEDKKVMAQMQKECEDLKRQLEEVDSISIFKDESEIKALQKKLDEKQQEVDDLKKRLDEVEGEREDAKKKLEELELEKEKQLEGFTPEPSLMKEPPSYELETLRGNLEFVESEVKILRTKLEAAEFAKDKAEAERKKKEEQLNSLLDGNTGKASELARAREDLENLRKRYDELLEDKKREDEWRSQNATELETTRHELEVARERVREVMRVKEDEAGIHQREADSWKKKDEEKQEELKKVSMKLEEMVREVEQRNEVLRGLNEEVEGLRGKEGEVEDLRQQAERAGQKVRELEGWKENKEAEVERFRNIIQDLEEKLTGNEREDDDHPRVRQLEQKISEMSLEMERINDQADQEVEDIARELDGAKALAQQAEGKIEILAHEVADARRIQEAIKQAAEMKIKELNVALGGIKAAAETKIADLEDRLIRSTERAAAAQNEVTKLEMQMKVEEARALATVAAATERASMLEKQVKAVEVLKRHKAQDESDLHSLKSHVVKIERIALQFLPLEDSGMLNAIDELKKSHLETQQKHKKRRKKEAMMAERSGLQL